MPENRHLFIIDPLASLNLALDSSLRLMAALAARGAEIYVAEPRQLGWQKSEGQGHARTQRLRFKSAATSSAPVPQFTPDPLSVRELGAFRAVHMRKDPPYDMDYIATTWLLDAVGSGTKVYNAPSALRGLNEKLAIFGCGEAARDAMVSADPEELLGFVEKQAGGDAVLKPLTLFGGRGVFRLSAEPRDAALQKLREETQDGASPRLVQAFDPAIFQGEVRVFTAFGEPIAWCLKKPSDGNFLANTRMGATLSPYSPRPDEQTRVLEVAQNLRKIGVEFIGFDLIGGFVSEVNITSPRLLAGPGDEADHYGRIADLVQKDLA